MKDVVIFYCITVHHNRSIITDIRSSIARSIQPYSLYCIGRSFYCYSGMTTDRNAGIAIKQPSHIRSGRFSIARCRNTN